MPDLLSLSGLVAGGVTDMGDHYRIGATGTVIPTVCHSCASPLYRHGSQPQSYMDTPMHGKRVLIEIDRKRYRCKSCGKTLFEPLQPFDDKRLMTQRLVAYIESHCTRKTFADLSREVGVDAKTVRHIFDDYVSRLKKTVIFQTPEIMGIDELKIIGQYRAMITNVGKLSLFDMLPTRNKTDIVAYLKTMPDKGNVRLVTMDMWNPYRQAVQTVLPERPIVADRFHVVRMANNAVEAVRKTIRKGLTTHHRLKLKDDRFVLLSRLANLNFNEQEKLKEWSNLFPALGAAYRAKEEFHDLYNLQCRTDAERAAKAWIQNLDPSIEWAFKDLKTALGNWWVEIFNHYEYPISNGYTESINNVAKGMNRMGRGYSFEVIRARLLYDKTARAKTTQTVRKKNKRIAEQPTDGFAFFLGLPEPTDQTNTKIIEYGPHLPTLARLLEEGYFS